MARAVLYIQLIHHCCTVANLASSLLAQNSIAQEPAPSPEVLSSIEPTRTRLASYGIRPFATFTSEVWGNADGGLKQGAWWNQLLDFGLELDCSQLGLWPGGKFLAQAHWVANSHRNSTFADYAGAVNPVSGIMAADHFRVFNLYYRQSWDEDFAVVKIGQMAADEDFMGSVYSALFANSAFGGMPSQLANRLARCCSFSPEFPVYPVAAPAIVLSIHPSHLWDIQAGIYDGVPGEDKPGNHGFDWARQSHAQLGFFLETAYHYQLGQRAAALKLGATYHTGALESFSPGAEPDHDGTRQAVPNFYIVQDLELVKSADGFNRLGLFCRAGVTPDTDRSIVAAYMDGGLNWFAPLRCRPDDVSGIALSYTRLGREYVQSTGRNGFGRDQTALELTYLARLTPWFSMQADAQFLFNPAANPQTGTRQMATVLGIRAKVSF